MLSILMLRIDSLLFKKSAESKKKLFTEAFSEQEVNCLAAALPVLGVRLGDGAMK